MGQYNADLTTEPVVPRRPPRVSTQFAYRLIFFGDVISPVTSQPSWQYFAPAPELDRTNDTDTATNLFDIGAGWHRYAATITPESITLTLDLFRDGKRRIDSRSSHGRHCDRLCATALTPRSLMKSRLMQRALTHCGSVAPLASLLLVASAIAFDNISLKLVDTAPPATPGDFNLDGTVDAADYVVWRNKPPTPTTIFGGPTSASRCRAAVPPKAAAVPEPSSLTLLVVLIGLASLRPEINGLPNANEIPHAENRVVGGVQHSLPSAYCAVVAELLDA